MNIRNVTELKEAIAILENKRIQKEMDMTYHLNAYAHEVKESMINISMGVGSGMIAKKIIAGKSNGFIGSLAANAVQGLVTKTVFGNADKIKAIGYSLWKNLFKK